MIRIRRARTRHDAQIIGEMIFPIWREPVSDENLDRLFHCILKFPDGHLITSISGRPAAVSVGFPIYKKPSFSDLNNRFPYHFFKACSSVYLINLIDVLPLFRNKGIESAILDRHIAAARNHFFGKITGLASLSSVDIWRRKGFSDMGEAGRYRKSGVVQWMEKDI